MSGGIDPALAAIIAALITASVGWLTYRSARSKNNTDAAQGLIDQLQEERDTDRTKNAADIARLTDRMDGMEHRERLLLDYVEDLRMHISNGRPPPPPQWPEGLQRG